MQVKYFVGKDRRLDAKKKKRAVARSGPVTCRNCGDEFDRDGFCVKCRSTLEMYRGLDNERFAQFQSVMQGE